MNTSSAANISYRCYLLLIAIASLPPSRHDIWPMLLLSLAILCIGIIYFTSCIRYGLNIIAMIKPYKIPVLLLALTFTWVLIQATPLPANFIALLAPYNAASQDFIPADNITLSLVRGDTIIKALFTFALLVFFMLSVVLHQRTDRVRTTLLVIVLCGVAQSLYGSFMVLSGLEYGFFAEKTAYRGVATGTFYNRNHLAGFLEMCLASGIGLLVSTLRGEGSSNWKMRLRQGLDAMLGPKMRLRIFLAFMVIALVLTRSRMGNTAFFSALILSSGLYMLAERRIHWGAILLFTSLMLVDFLIVGQWFGFDELAERLENTSVETESRDEVAGDTVKMAEESPLAGYGLGSFYSVYRVFQQSEVRGYYDHTHNDFLEFLGEIGLIGIAPLALLVLTSTWMGVTAMFMRRNRLAKGLGFASTMGIISLMIHSAVDFNLQITVNAMMFVFILSLGWIARKQQLEDARI